MDLILLTVGPPLLILLYIFYGSFRKGSNRFNSLEATHTANVSIDAKYFYYKSRNPNVIDRVQTLFTNYKNNPSADTECCF